jgi:hypothetical protein
VQQKRRKVGISGVNGLKMVAKGIKGICLSLVLVVFKSTRSRQVLDWSRALSAAEFFLRTFPLSSETIRKEVWNR